MSRLITTVIIATMTFFLTWGIVSWAKSIDSLEVLPNQSAEKKIKSEPLKIKVVPTYGFYGGERLAPYFPGENFCVSLCCTGMTEGPDEKIDALLTFDLCDTAGNLIFSLGTIKSQIFLPYVRTRFPFCCGFPLRSQKIELAGEYQVRVTVDDHVSGQHVTQYMPITILTKGTFGATNLHFSQDADSKIPCGWCTSAGTPVCLHYFLTGCKSQKGRIRVLVTCSARKHNSNSMVGEPIEAVLEIKHNEQRPNDIATNLCELPPGHYGIVLHLEDQLAREEAAGKGKLNEEMLLKTEVTYEIPFLVVDPSE